MISNYFMITYLDINKPTPITHKSTQFQKLCMYSNPIDLISIASSIKKYNTNAKSTNSHPAKNYCRTLEE